MLRDSENWTRSWGLIPFAQREALLFIEYTTPGLWSVQRSFGHGSLLVDKVKTPLCFILMGYLQNIELWLCWLGVAAVLTVQWGVPSLHTISVMRMVITEETVFGQQTIIQYSKVPVNNTATKTKILDKKQLRCQRSVIVSSVRDDLCGGLGSHLLILLEASCYSESLHIFYLRLVCMIHVFLVLCSLIDTKLCLWWVHLLLSKYPWLYTWSKSLQFSSVSLVKPSDNHIDITALCHC